MEAALKAISHQGRREILSLISTRERSVNELAQHFPDISGPAVSQHLKVLRDAGLVEIRKEGTFRYYRANSERLEEVRRALEDFWGPTLGRLDAAIEQNTKRAGR